MADTIDVEIPVWSGSVPSAAEVLAQLLGYPRETTVENVGAPLLYVGADHSELDEDSDGEVQDTAVHVHDWEAAEKAGIAESEDLYALLGLGHLKIKATADDIRLAYRDLCVRFHPDQRRPTPAEEAEDSLFKAMSHAFEVLSDPARRRIYDSKDGPVVRVPSADTSDFYRDFGDAFRAAGYWSTRQPVPHLGKDNASAEHIDHFYEFWMNYSSWRDWSFAAEHDVAKAEGRDERRWMERENERITAKKKREEMNKAIQLVELAFKIDPRLKRRREQEKLDREREREAKREAVRQAELEKQRLVEEEQKRAKDAAETARREKERVKREARRQRKRIRDGMAACGAATANLDATAVESTCARLSTEQVSDLADALERGDAAPFCAAVAETVRLAKEEQAAKAAAVAAAEAARLAKLQRDRKPWTVEEEALLAKAVAKFPGGTPNRWERIADFVRTRTPKDVQEMVTQLRQGVRLEVSAFERSQQLAKAKKEVVPDTITVAYERTADSAPAAATAAAAAPATAPTAAPAAAPASSAASAAAAPSAAVDDWSPAQQKALEEGLRKHPATLENRWELIAAGVPGKSVRDCMLRFQELARRIKAARAAKEAQAAAQQKA